VNTSLARVANSIRFYGAVPSLELTHAGMYGNRNLPMFSIGDVINKPSYGPVDCEVSGKAIFAMTEEIIERTIRKFAAGAALGKRCGYGMVTLHADTVVLISFFPKSTREPTMVGCRGKPCEDWR
jgi:2,4-dienoyl-CoA reductase-like NADH-dependent reductase (Old Yellow Enzyme family)